jgi:hypothetical protein
VPANNLIQFEPVSAPPGRVRWSRAGHAVKGMGQPWDFGSIRLQGGRPARKASSRPRAGSPTPGGRPRPPDGSSGSPTTIRGPRSRRLRWPGRMRPRRHALARRRTPAR